MSRYQNIFLPFSTKIQDRRLIFCISIKIVLINIICVKWTQLEMEHFILRFEETLVHLHFTNVCLICYKNKENTK
jgi:hypothetical protein